MHAAPVKKREPEEDIYTFRLEEGRWHICLEAYLERGWSRQDLEMVEGAGKLLDALACGDQELRLRIATTPFKGARLLELVEHCIAPKGGGIYLFDPESEHDSALYWICDLTLFVFGDMPERIYLRRLPLRSRTRVEKRQSTGIPNPDFIS